MLEIGLMTVRARGAGWRRKMNQGVRLITILLAVVLLSAGFAWTQSGRTPAPSDRPCLDDSAPSGVTTSADDNKIVCCWKCPDDGLMKCKVTSVSFCNKMGRQVSSCGECQ
jgi:hypothetical protein